MTVIGEFPKDTSFRVEVTERPRGLSAIHEPGCIAAIWRRQPLPEFQSWIDTLHPDFLPRGRVVLRPEQVREAVFHFCEAAGTPDCADRTRLIDDTAALAYIFGGLMRTPFLRLRINVGAGDAERNSDLDAVAARLACTYRGAETRYGSSSKGGVTQPICTVPTGTPILLRGNLWPETPRLGLLQRLSFKEHTHETRLTLALDPVFDPDERPHHTRMH
ncbi:MAG: DUF1826 domain-containing protein [Pseudomonadota bacterium]